MALVCRNCSRVNPPEARYCYWDGAVLDGHARGGGPVDVGSQPFHSPFVFPSGRACGNFGELVLACYADWKEALEVLRAGYLGGFFGALGRADLALAAKQALQEADPDRGLDALLSKLPCDRRDPPQIRVEPREVHLGQTSRTADRRFVLQIKNEGMGLLQGTAVCDGCGWLTLGEGAGAPRKVFQCLGDYTLPVQVHGKALRAGNKTLEGRINIESNGGSTVIEVRADVPVQPFPEGVLAGAVSPRQVAEKAKLNPRGAAPLFEKGAVAAWYESNGWIYPVQGPASAGLGAIQQFFEALGLVKAPVVEISEQSVHLQGPAGASLEHIVQVQAKEKRPVFAYATTTTPWIKIGRVVLDGRTARIPLKVPSVPGRPGEQMKGTVQVTSNGNQRFVVEVALSVTGRVSVRPDRLAAGEVIDISEAVPGPLAATAAEVIAETETMPEVLPLVEALPSPGNDLVFDHPAAPAGERHGRHPRRASEHKADRPRRTSGGSLKHLLPLGLLGLCLLAVGVHDLVVILLRLDEEPAAEPALLDPDPYIAIRFHDGPKGTDEEKKDMPDPTMRFGLVMLREKDPKHPDRLKKLTFDEWGRTNNACLRVDGKEFLFGQPPGVWDEMKRALSGERAGRPRDGLASAWRLPDVRVEVTQEVEVVPGEQSRRLDTCLVRYTLENKDSRRHKVGIRFMLDTYIGANDGVPFLIPGLTGLADEKKSFDKAADVPDFIEALEKDDPRNPGTVAYLQFRVGAQIESPARVTLGGWPNAELRQFGKRDARYGKALSQLTGWDVPFISMKELTRLARTIRKQADPDSAVTMYWEEKELAAGANRVVGFAYGLGSADTSESEGHLLLTVGGRLVRKGEFTLTALVHNPQPGERLTLTLPDGFALADGKAEQEVPEVPAAAERKDSPVTWRVRAGEDGKYDLVVRSNKGARQKLPVTIRTRGVFD